MKKVNISLTWKNC